MIRRQVLVYKSVPLNYDELYAEVHREDLGAPEIIGAPTKTGRPWPDRAAALKAPEWALQNDDRAMADQ